MSLAVRRPPGVRSAWFRVTCAWLLTVAARICCDAGPSLQTAAAPAPEAAGTRGLADLARDNLRCARAGLNAAAREARKVPPREPTSSRISGSPTTRITPPTRFISKSNYPDEKELRYCVAIYCQQDGTRPIPRLRLACCRQRRAAGQAAVRQRRPGDCSRPPPFLPPGV